MVCGVCRCSTIRSLRIWGDQEQCRSNPYTFLPLPLGSQPPRLPLTQLPQPSLEPRPPPVVDIRVDGQDVAALGAPADLGVAIRPDLLLLAQALEALLVVRLAAEGPRRQLLRRPAVQLPAARARQRRGMRGDSGGRAGRGWVPGPAGWGPRAGSATASPATAATTAASPLPPHRACPLSAAGSPAG